MITPQSVSTWCQYRTGNDNAPLPHLSRPSSVSCDGSVGHKLICVFLHSGLPTDIVLSCCVMGRYSRKDAFIRCEENGLCRQQNTLPFDSQTHTHTHTHTHARTHTHCPLHGPPLGYGMSGEECAHTLTSPKSSRLPLSPPHALRSTKNNGEVVTPYLSTATTVSCPPSPCNLPIKNGCAIQEHLNMSCTSAGVNARLVVVLQR